MKKRYQKCLFFSMMFIATLAFSKGAVAQKALAFAVYQNSSDTNCTSSPAASSEEYRNIFRDGAIDEWGWSSSNVLRKSNKNVNWSDFGDMYVGSTHWGKDYQSKTGADWADITFLATHGGARVHGCSSKDFTYPNCGAIAGCSGDSYSEFEMGSSSSSDFDCDVRTTHMALNGGYSPVGGAGYNADVFMTRACHSAVPCVWRNGGYDSLGRQGFRMYNGFYGPHRQNSTDYTNMETYMASTSNDGIGSKWLSVMNTRRHDNVGNNCPVSIVYCQNASSCNNMFFNGGANDLKNTGTRNMSRMYYVGGCNPSRTGNNYPVLPGTSGTTRAADRNL